jgi:PhzF family phenazine biosynthesis protein
MEFPYAEMHAFPDGHTPHTGNPAGVVMLHRDVPDADLLGVAQSNNLSETAYLKAMGEKDQWSLRWFTPGLEVELCGHATLASAAWLFETGRVVGPEARFHTLSGLLKVTRLEDGRYQMDFPQIGFDPGQDDAAVIAAMGADAPEAVYEIERVHGNRYQMLVYADEAVVVGLNPDIKALAATRTNVIATAPGRASDFVSRFFGPASGVDEDPVTGSAHCTLAPYWFDRLGRTALKARQVGPRPGALEVRAGAAGRVLLVGSAKRYLDGVIRI